MCKEMGLVDGLGNTAKAMVCQYLLLDKERNVLFLLAPENALVLERFKLNANFRVIRS